ncbi:hypothetical protein TrVE_jg2423 [Triparma verrucosa]|uniref:Actin-related protein 4 n=1 Tax=Triparma verrucosa TaxID=1606542 RepID=A0A9W7CHW5_9STRA|nr:hypothetical protein TrVE_jg2423 [Triparma verrucosa]
MFCGDETGAYVVETGWTNSRFGWGGAADPCLQIPTLLTHKGSIGLSALNSNENGNHATRIFDNPNNTSEITNWDAWETLMSQSISQTLCSDRPILTMDPGFSPPDQKETQTEIMFEKFQAPAYFISHNAALSAFSLGRHTAMVVDCGGGGNVATPVIDGIVLKRSLRRSVRGGDFLDLQLKEVIEKKTGKPLAVRPERLPSGKYKSPTNAHLSSLSASEKAYRDFCVHASMTDFKKSHGVSLQFAKVDMREVSGLIPDGSVYELPDGTPVNVNEHPDLYVVPEAMFMEGPLTKTPSDPAPMDVEGSDQSAPSDPSLLDVPLHRLAHSALSEADVDCRKELLMNLVLCGRGSRFSGLDTRLNKELTAMTPSTFRVKVASGKGEERSNASWIGGSILTSLGSFQQLWLSKAEYDEYGSTLAVQRFP